MESHHHLWFWRLHEIKIKSTFSNRECGDVSLLAKLCPVLATPWTFPGNTGVGCGGCLFSFSRSSQPRDPTRGTCIRGRVYHWATRGKPGNTGWINANSYYFQMLLCDKHSHIAKQRDDHSKISFEKEKVLSYLINYICIIFSYTWYFKRILDYMKILYLSPSTFPYRCSFKGSNDYNYT